MKNKFSKGSKTYDENANVQKYMIDTLLDNLPKKKYGNILEIGCGTGLLTTKLIELFPDAKIIAIDISNDMIHICKEKTKGYNIHFICCDIEEYAPIDQFDLIISSATFQWMSNLEELLSTLKSRLSPDGIIAFSTFANGTFKELDTSLNEVFKTNNIHAKQTRNYYSNTQMLELLNSVFREENYFNSVSHSKYVEYFKDSLVFLKSVKAVGANSSDIAKHMSPQITKQVLDYYNKNYCFNNSSNIDFKDYIHATYYMLFCTVYS